MKLAPAQAGTVVLIAAIAAVYAAPPPTSHPLYETAADTELLYRQWGQSMPSPLLKEFLEQAEANQEKKGVDLSARMNLPGPLGDVARLGSSVFDNTRAISNGAIESSGTVRESDALGAPAAELAHSRLSPSTPHGSSNLGSAASKEKPVVPDTRLLPSKRKAVDAVSASQSPPGKRVLPPIVNVPTKEVVNLVPKAYQRHMNVLIALRRGAKDFNTWKKLNVKIERIQEARPEALRLLKKARYDAQVAARRGSQHAAPITAHTPAEQAQTNSPPVQHQDQMVEKIIDSPMPNEPQPHGQPLLDSSTAGATTQPVSPRRWLAELENDAEFWNLVDS